MALDRWAVIEVIDKDGKRSTGPGNRDLDFAMTIGKEWKYDFRNRSVTGGYSDYVNGYRVEAFEDVRTKAGTFKAFRINLRQENVGSLHWTGQLDFWWSPEVRGFVKRKVSTSNWLKDYELERVTLKPVRDPSVATGPASPTGVTAPPAAHLSSSLGQSSVTAPSAASTPVAPEPDKSVTSADRPVPTPPSPPPTV